MKKETLNEKSFDLLNNRQLLQAAEIAHYNLVNNRKDIHMDDRAFIARCWMEGLLTILIKEGKVKLNE